MGKTYRRRILLAALLSCLPPGAEAKVLFTGYGDLRYSTGLRAKISGEPATLKAFSLQEGGLVSRSFSADTIGLFASTEVQEDLQFLMDLSFKSIGNNVGLLKLQYAYLHWTPREHSTLDGGRVTIPFGYLNENRFYAFQRYTISPPVFPAGILGLPISDWGVTGRQRFPLSHAAVEASAYMVNGYGNQGTNKTGLRVSTLPGGLALSSNLAAADNNHKPSVGGRLSLKDIGGAQVETGASYFWGYWDKSGLEPMGMAGLHAHANAGGWDVLAEYLHLAVRGDQGFAASIGGENWTTTGGFVTVSYDKLKVKGKTVAPFAQSEFYRTRPNNGGTDREVMRSASGGVAVRGNEHLLFKAEVLHLIYVLPDAKRSGSLRIDIDQALLAAVVTF